MNNITDLKLDRYVNVNHQVRITEGLVLTVNCGTNSILRVLEIDRQAAKEPMPKPDYYKAVLRACTDKDECETFIALDPQPWVWELVMAAVKKILKQANTPFFGELPIEGEVNETKN